MSRFSPLRWLTKTFVWIIRGSPLMLQILIVFYGPGLLFGWKALPRFTAALVTFVINYACYFSEIYRGGIQGVPKGQQEAGQVLGMTKSQIFFKVTLLQVVKRIVPPMGNEFITLVKDTSLSNFIMVGEIIKLAKDFKTTVAHILPSYALILGEHLRNMGEDPRDFPLRIAVVGAEPYTVEFRRRIEELFDMKAYNSYGLSEMNGPGVAFECQNQNGLHVWEDAYLPEIVDPKTGEPVPDGEIGELVMTCLCRQGMPILRYRTRDLTSLDYTPCRCGRTHVRLTRIRGRSDDMLIIRGVNVFPQQIEALLMENQNLSPNYQIIVDRVNNLDTLEVQVEMNETLFADEIRKLQSLESSIQKSIKEFLGVTTKVRLMEPHSIQRSEGKAKRIIDKRPTE